MQDRKHGLTFEDVRHRMLGERVPLIRRQLSRLLLDMRPERAADFGAELAVWFREAMYILSDIILNPDTESDDEVRKTAMITLVRCLEYAPEFPAKVLVEASPARAAARDGNRAAIEFFMNLDSSRSGSAALLRLSNQDEKRVKEFFRRCGRDWDRIVEWMPAEHVARAAANARCEVEMYKAGSSAASMVPHAFVTLIAYMETYASRQGWPVPGMEQVEGKWGAAFTMPKPNIHEVIETWHEWVGRVQEIKAGRDPRKDETLVKKMSQCIVEMMECAGEALQQLENDTFDRAKTARELMQEMAHALLALLARAAFELDLYRYLALA